MHTISTINLELYTATLKHLAQSNLE